jgi:uracil-DNA glycosylase
MTWSEILGPVLASEKMQELKSFIKEERQNKHIYPEGKDVFRAFDLCPYDNTKVVILGQDPYNQKGQADGLAFSSRLAQRPKSLEVIFKEIYTDLNIQYFHNVTLDEFFPTNDLTNWTKIGILLLNSVLTVEELKPGSHKGKGWENIVEAVFEGLNKKDHQIVFFLWGRDAQQFKELIKNPKHIYLEAPHPAAELYKDNENAKATFTGCRHFSILRDILPMIHNQNIYKTIGLDACFDKEKAKKIVRENYPIEADKICKYIDKDLIIHVPVNRDNYFQELHNIESQFSTKMN